MKLLSQTHICNSMFIAVLFTIAKTWEQPRCLSPRLMDKENTHIHIYMCTHIHMCLYINRNTHIYIHTMEYYSAIKRSNFFLPFTTWMNLEGIMLSQIRERQILYDLIYMWWLPRVYEVGEIGEGG